VRALLSVSDKSDLVPFAQGLVELGFELVSSGGTHAALTEAGLAARKVSEVTAADEMLDGRVKTLHPMIHGGILALRDEPEHRAAMDAHGIAPIDLVVVNLYPFEATLARGADFATCIENIDIGGPAMVRAAAKNHDFVGVVTGPADYEAVLSDLEARGGALSGELRLRLAAKAYGHTAFYDSMIARWMEGTRGETFPEQLTIGGRLKGILRYGENPHQNAALYGGFLEIAEPLHGKELSFNNLVDVQAAVALIQEFSASASASASASVGELTPSNRGPSLFWLVLGGGFRFTFASWLLGEVLGLVRSWRGSWWSRLATRRSWRRTPRRSSSDGRPRVSSSIGTMSSSGSRFRPASFSWKPCCASFQITR